MSMPVEDQAPNVAHFLMEILPAEFRAGSITNGPAAVEAILRHIPTLTLDGVARGGAIYDDLTEAGRLFEGHMAMINSPCACGRPGTLVLVGKDWKPTGERRCEPCDLAEAAKTPCDKCGGPMDLEQVRCGFLQCDACDLDGEHVIEGDF